jgi:carnitine-CoA ligase
LSTLPIAPSPHLTFDGVHPFAGTSVWKLLEMRAAMTPSATFFTWQPFEESAEDWCYARFRDEAAVVAAGLQARGLRAGERLLIHLNNCPEFLLSWFACAALGVVAVTTNTRSAPDEINYFAHDADVRVAITEPGLVDVVAQSAPGLDWLVTIDNDWSARPTKMRVRGISQLRSDRGALAVVPPDPVMPMSVQYTSGTTARPKGVVWSHANALWSARVNAAHMRLMPSDCQLAYLPLFHTNAIAYTMLSTLWTGSRFVLVPKWSTSRFWTLAHEHHITWLPVIGFVTQALLASGPPRKPHSLRMFGSGICDAGLDGIYGTNTVGWYGSTETISHPVLGDPYLPNSPRSMGRPAPEYGVKVVEADGMTPVAVGDTGEMLVRGVRGLSVFATYLNQPEAVAASFDQDGWFRTGDLATTGDDGFLTYAGRTKDMLRVGSENVGASEVERVILTIPGVAEAAVVGRRHPALQQVPVAFVVPQRGALAIEEILDTCRRKLADFKVPREIYVVSALPRSLLNKVNKTRLREVADPDSDRDSALRLWVEQRGSLEVSE